MLVKTLRIAGLLAILAVTGPSAQAATLLDSLQWENGVLILGFDGPFESRSLVMSEPDRIVLDFPGVRSTLAQASYPGEGELQRIRVGQNEPDEPGGLKARIVLDLAAPQNFLTEAGERSLRIVLSATTGSATPAVESSARHSAAVAVPSEAQLAEAPLETLSSPVPAAQPAEPATPPLMAAGLFDASALAAPQPSSATAKLESEDPAPAAWESAASPAPVSTETMPSLIPASASDPIFVASDPFEPTAEERLFAELPAPPAEVSASAAVPEFASAEEPKVVWTARAAATEAETAPAPIATPAAPAAVESESAASPAPLLASAAGSIASGEALFAAFSAPEASAPSAAAPVAHQVETPSAPAVAADFGRELTLAAAAEELSGRPAVTTPPVQVAQADAPATKREERAPEPLLLSGKRAAKSDNAPITLEMRGAEFRTLLHAFSEFAGVNIVAGKEVQGKVSVHLTAVPWREALAAVCSANGYTVKEEYGVLRVAPRGSLLQEEMELLTAERKRSEYLPLETEVIKLSYAVAAELTEPLAKMLSERGKMDVDDRTNAILVTDLPENVRMVVDLAHRLDLLMPQVEITARIVDLDYRASRDLGIKWEALNISNDDLGLAGSGTVDGSFASPVADVKLGTVRSWGELNVAIQALELANKANIISTPRVTTMDNREANILVGKKIPLIVADEAGNAITQLTTIGIKMVVTPHINPDGKIMMSVLTEVSDLSSEATVQGGVIITTSESKTNVMVDDGSTAVIAGLIKSSDSSLNRTVPFLGRLPVIGRVFGYSNQNDSKRELIIFITPRIVEPGAASSEAQLRDQGYTLPLGG